MAIDALMTELAAVNIMLETIGESPVASLVDSGLVDVTIAQGILNDTIRQVQEEGWHFNTDEEYELTPDVDDHINLPSNTLRVSLAPTYRNLDVTQRGTKLYDRENHTDEFDDKLKVNLVLLLVWDDLPQAARWYITVKAARRFQNKSQMSDTIYKFSKEDENDARDKLLKADEKDADYNFIAGHPALVR